jgi:hypothetical protein
MSDGTAFKEIKNNKYNLSHPYEIGRGKSCIGTEFYPNKFGSSALFPTLAVLYQFLIANIFKSSITSPVHLFRGHLVCIVSFILSGTICLGIVSLFVLSICPYHVNLSNFYKCYVCPCTSLFFLFCSFLLPLWPLLFLTFFL